MEFYSGLSQVQATHALCLWDGLGFRPPPSAAPAALCPLASCGLLWRALRCTLDLSEWWNRLVLVLTGPILSKTLCDPLSARLLCPWDCHAPLLETHRGSTAAPLDPTRLSEPCRERKVFCQDTEVKNPSLWSEDERTRWEMLQREGTILKSFPELLLCGCCRLGGWPMTIRLSLVFWP